MEIEGSPRPFPLGGVCFGAVALILAFVGVAYLGLLGGHPGAIVGAVLAGAGFLALTIAGPISWYLRGARTRRRRFGAVLRSLVFPLAIIVPLFVFLGSSTLVPDWTGQATMGWLSCIHAGNWLWTPFVVWACAAMYARHAAGAMAPWRWVTLGMIAGAIASGIMSVMLLLQMSRGSVPDIGGSEALWFASIPLATFGVYLAAAIRRWREAPVGMPAVGTIVVTSGLAVVMHVRMAMQVFGRLPDTSPDCYVVTAASHGHARIVKPLFVTSRHGRLIRVNAQLMVLWELERRWAERSARTHRVARVAYDLVGPVLARAISGPFRADAAYIALKPLEWLARRMCG